MKEAMRDEMRRILDDGEFTVTSCSTLMRMAEAARDFLRANAVKPEDLTTDQESGADVIGIGPAAPVAETFGSKMIRELLAAMPDLVRMQRENPGSLVQAIAMARSQGMPDVAAALEKRLVGARLDGARPVSPLGIPFIPMGALGLDASGSPVAQVPTMANGSLPTVRFDGEPSPEPTPFLAPGTGDVG